MVCYKPLVSICLGAFKKRALSPRPSTTELHVGEQNDEALMREIDEELRQDQFKKIWDKFGNLIVGTALAVVLVVAGYQGWQAYDKSRKTEATDRLIGAIDLINQGDSDAALSVLRDISTKGVDGVSIIATFRKAAILSDQKDHAAAATAFKGIAADTGIAERYRDLATILAAAQELEADKSNADAVIETLQPMTEPTQVWRHTAREILAAAALVAGRKDQARGFLQAIVLDPQAPNGLRSRAQELIQAVGE